MLLIIYILSTVFVSIFLFNDKLRVGKINLVNE